MIRLIKPYIAYDEVETEFQDVFDSGMFTRGKYVEQFRGDLKNFIGCKYSYLTTSATTALSLCLEIVGVSKDDEVLVSDFSFPASVNVIENIGAKPVFVDVDLETYNMLSSELEKKITSSLDYIFEKHDIDIVFNCATKALNYSFVNPKSAFDTNVNGILNILEHQRKGSFKTLVHFSTSEVYGSAVYEPMDEKHPINPTTTYAAGKAAADIAVRSWVDMFDLDAFIVRPFNNYGPRQNYKGYLAGVIPITAYRILKGINPEIHGTGLQSRDFIFVLDTIDAIIKLYPLMKKSDSINISTDGQITMKEVINKVASLLEYKGEILNKPVRASDVKSHNASNAKVKSMINYQLTSFEDGLAKTIAWYKENIK